MFHAQHYKIEKSGYQEVIRPGPATILTTDEEALLCDWLVGLCRRGIPIQKDLLLDSIQCILTDDPRSNPFSNNRPGKGWKKQEKHFYVGMKTLHKDMLNPYHEVVHS